MFWSGESFKTRGLIKEGNFKTAGARYTDAKPIDVHLLDEWLTESRDVQWAYKNIVKRKGRLLRIKERRPRGTSHIADNCPSAAQSDRCVFTRGAW